MRKKLLPLLALAGVATLAPESPAAPFVPQAGNEVLERLRERPLDSAARELRALRATLARDPDNLAIAANTARRYIEESRAQGDPRYLGYAQAALSPWWSQAQPPNAVLLMRATIRQSNHDFDAALVDLSRVLETAPGNAQAWLTRATILQVQGHYAEAAQSCERLSQLAPTYAVSCSSEVAALTGQAARSYEILAGLLEKIAAPAVAQKVWMETGLAEIAVRLGRHDVAEAHFKRALQQGAADPYLKAAYADFLLDAGRPGEVVLLLNADIRIDALVLRLALAEQALGARELSDRVATLQARFDAARARGDKVHLREEARFHTALLKQPGEGLRLAQANWAVQKEPADARVLLEAALAANDRKAAQPVIDWMSRSKLEDAALSRLMQRIQQS